MAVGHELRGIPEGKGQKGAFGLAEAQLEDPRAADLSAWAEVCLLDSLPAPDPGSGGRPRFHHDGKTRALDSRHRPSPGLSPDSYILSQLSQKPSGQWSRRHSLFIYMNSC